MFHGRQPLGGALEQGQTFREAPRTSVGFAEEPGDDPE
jgi:hypothetical protein